MQRYIRRCNDNILNRCTSLCCVPACVPVCLYAWVPACLPVCLVHPQTCAVQWSHKRPQPFSLSTFSFVFLWYSFLCHSLLPLTVNSLPVILSFYAHSHLFCFFRYSFLCHSLLPLTVNALPVILSLYVHSHLVLCDTHFCVTLCFLSLLTLSPSSFHSMYVLIWCFAILISVSLSASSHC